jgi:hypothetical protein
MELFLSTDGNAIRREKSLWKFFLDAKQARFEQSVSTRAPNSRRKFLRGMKQSGIR